MRLDVAAVKLEAETSEFAGAGGYLIFTGEQHTRSFFGLHRSPHQVLRVLDQTGVVRLQRARARQLDLLGADQRRINPGG